MYILGNHRLIFEKGVISSMEKFFGHLNRLCILIINKITIVDLIQNIGNVVIEIQMALEIKICIKN